MQTGQGISIIPTRCPKFLAVCATVGIELQPGTPGVSNCYSAGRKYDRDEPGDISFHLSERQGINPLAISKVWRFPDEELADCAALPGRLISCRTPDDWEKLIEDVEILHLTGAVANIRKFSEGKFAIDSKTVSDGEKRSAQVMSGMAESMRRDKSRNGGKVAASLAAHWTPSMFAWVKAWVTNYLELREAWKTARPSIKIDRGDGFPLVIPKGKDFAKLMRRWA